jgi:hypothetical protein
MQNHAVKNVCLVNGSLRGRQASSLEFIKDVSSKLPDTEYVKTFLTVKAKVTNSYPENMLESMAHADAIIFVFPLHNYGLPGALMRLLEDYNKYIRTGKEYYKKTKVYVIVNCAFPRPADTCGEAIRVIQNFCRRFSLNWRFAICIGTGPVVAMTKKVPFLYPRLKRAYTEIALDIQSGDREKKRHYFIKPIIPEAIINMIKRYYEKKGRMIEKN